MYDGGALFFELFELLFQHPPIVRLSYAHEFHYKLRSPKKNLTKDLKIGARGGGFTLRKGTTTWIQTSRARTNKIKIFIRKKPIDKFHTTRTVTELLLRKTDRKYRITIIIILICQ